MAASVGSLIVNLGVNTRAFQKKMRRSGRTVNVFAMAVKTASRKILAFGGALATAGGAAGLVLLTRRSFQTIDALSKTSELLGTTTAELGGFHHAARLAGIETRTFDMGLQRMTRRISEAAHGTGEARGALRQLGLDATALAAKGTGAAFLDVVEALDKVQNAGDQVRLGMRLFDSEGVKLIRMSRGGAAALRAVMKEARRMGIAVSEVGAAKIVMANNAIYRLKASFQGLGNVIAVKVAPALGALATWFSKFLSGINWGKVLDTIASQVRFWAAGIIGEFHKIATGFMDLIADLLSVAQRIPAFVLGEGAMSQILHAQHALENVARGMREMEPPSVGFLRWFDGIAAGAQKAAQAIADLAAKRRGSMGMDVVLDNMKKADQIVNDLRKSVETYGMTTRRVQLLELGKLSGDLGQFAKATGYVRLLEALDKNKAAMAELRGGGPGGGMAQRAGALEFGSVAAYSAALGRTNDVGRNTKRIAELTAKGNELDRERNQLLRERDAIVLRL